MSAHDQSKPARSVTHTVAGNTLWYGLELSLAIATTLLTTVPLARAMGPEKLSYFTYLQWLTNVSALLATMGVPAMTRKYMAEYLAKEDAGVLWAIYVAGIKLQLLTSGIVFTAGAVLTWFFVPADYQLISILLLSNVIAKLLGNMPSSANVAAEKMKLNFVGAVSAYAITIIAVSASLWFGWGLVGVAAGFAGATFVECFIKMAMTQRWLRRVPGATLPADLRSRMWKFSGQGLVLMGLHIIVWDRSDLLFLNWLSKRPSDLTFFGLAFNLVEKILLIPQAFTTVIGSSIMAEHGRSKEKLYRVTALAAKYSLMVSAPLMFGLAAISGPLMTLLYGREYLPMISVLSIAAALAVAKPMYAPVQSLMQAEERQSLLIKWTLACGALKMIMDMALIPSQGAQGAVIANGVAQGIAILAIWITAVRTLPIVAPISEVLRIVVSAGIMAGLVWCFGYLPWMPVFQIAVAVPLGALCYLVLLRAMQVLDASDIDRLRGIVRNLPRSTRKPASAVLDLFSRVNNRRTAEAANG